MQTIEGPHGTTMLVDDPATWAEKHRKYMHGLFGNATIIANPDGSRTVRSNGMDPLTFAREKATRVASSPTPEPAQPVGHIHEPLRRSVPPRRS